MRCERCHLAEAVKGWRFCDECKKAVRDEMKDAGYLKPVQKLGGKYRSKEQREATYDTKFGREP